MRRGGRRWIAAGLLALPAVVCADILLDGYNHIGDCDDTGGGCTGFTPLDPVSRNNNFNTPIPFHLTTTTTLDKVRLDGAVDLDGKLNIYIQGLFGSTVFRSGTLSGSEWDLIPDLVLSPGYYSVLADGGCSDLNSSGSYFYSNCASSSDNDFGFSSITIVSTQTSTSRMLIQRRHPGNNAASPTDNDSDDDYDYNDNGSPYYPDTSETHPMDITFNLDQNRRLSEIRFYRLRDVDNGAPSQSTLLVDGQQVGVFADSGDPLELNPTLITTNFLALAGNHTLRVQLGVISGSDVDSFSWDGIVLQFADVVSAGTLGFFNAVNTGANALTGTLGTKVAGGTPDVDIVALNALQTAINTAYTGTVEVTLMDATTDGTPDSYGCRWSTSTGLTTTLTFVAADQGRKALPAPFFSRAMQYAGLKMRDTSTGATGCAADKFALRPDRFTVSASHGTESTAGTVETLTNATDSGLPRHKAGLPFTLQLTAVDLSGAALATYAGTPDNTVAGTALAPATVNGQGSIGVAGWSGTGATRSTDNATYNEVGAFTLQATDSTFANVDVAESSASTRTITGSGTVGRFIPDKFVVTKSLLTPGCGSGASAFTYIGQSFGYPGAAITLTPVTGSSPATTTLNYIGTLNKLPATVTQAAFGITGTTLSVPTGAHALTKLLDASSTIALPSISVLRNATPVAPFAAAISITLPVFSDSDGVLPAESPIALTSATGGGTEFANGASQMRYGRLYIQPGAGSERAPLSLAMRTEYWDGVTFVPSSTDNCTLLQTANISLTPSAGASPAQTRTLSPAGPGPGPWAVTLSAPNVSEPALVFVDLSAVGPYLFLLDDDTDPDGNFDDNPSATASFGIFNRGDNRIYQREIYR